MTNDALSVLVCLFQSVWKLFSSWYIPGTNLTPAVLFFGIAFCFFVLLLVFSVRRVKVIEKILCLCNVVFPTL